MKKIIFILLFIFTTSLASDIQKEEFSSPATIGEGTLKVFFMEIYDLRLIANSPTFSWQKKFKLDFLYTRDLNKESVIKSSIKELRRQSNISDSDIESWKGHLEQSIKPVKEGTHASVLWSPEGHITFHYENNNPTIIEDENFARAFLNIWLGEETSQPKLRSQLFGGS
tara:strand:+ start:365 stop:871 length:507 start_codon:yes stop_codon:yes gene_type:complete